MAGPMGPSLAGSLWWQATQFAVNASAPFDPAYETGAKARDSGKALFWRLMWIYLAASAVAVVVSFTHP